MHTILTGEAPAIAGIFIFLVCRFGPYFEGIKFGINKLKIDAEM